MEFVTLNNGIKMPLEGFGVFQVPDPAPVSYTHLITTDIGIGGSNFTGLPGTASAGAAELLLTNGVGSINVQFQG